MNPTVTVLMAVFNPPLAMLDQAIDSILGQTYADFEFLILDDGSTHPGTRAHVLHRAHQDARIRIAWEPHRGLTKSLNRGLKLATGSWIARQDADDWSAPERLAQQVAYVREHPRVALCGSNAKTHQESGMALWSTRLPQTHADLLAAFPRGNPFVHGSVLFRKEAALELGGYREAFPCSQDYDLFWRMAECWEAVNLEQPLYHYRYTSGSISANRAADQKRAHTAIRQLALTRRTGQEADVDKALTEARDTSSRSVLRALLKQADHTMLAGDYHRAWHLYARLLTAYTWSPVAWGKLARLAIFQTLPSMREVCFR